MVSSLNNSSAVSFLPTHPHPTRPHNGELRHVLNKPPPTPCINYTVISSCERAGPCAQEVSRRSVLLLERQAASTSALHAIASLLSLFNAPRVLPNRVSQHFPPPDTAGSATAFSSAGVSSFIRKGPFFVLASLLQHLLLLIEVLTEDNNSIIGRIKSHISAG